MKALLLKGLRTAVTSLLFLAGLGLFAVLVLTGTEGGSAYLIRTTLDKVQEGSTLQVSIDDINGTFFSELAFARVNVRDAATGFRLNAEAMVVSLYVLELANSHVHLGRLEARGLAITLPNDNSGGDADPAAGLAALFNLPVTLTVDALSAAPFTLNGTSPQTLQSVTGSLQLDASRAHIAGRISRDDDTWAAPDLTLQAGTLAVNAVMPWQASLGGRPARGELTMTGDIHDLDISHVLSAPLAVTSTGSVTTGLRPGSEFGFDLAHQATNVGGTPFNLPELEDFSGTVTTAGTPARIQLGANADLRIAPVGNTVTLLDAVYAGDTLDIRSLSLRNERFSITASGTADFAAGTTFNLDWQLADFFDGDLWEQVVLENVNGSGAVNIDASGGSTVTALSLATLSGNLNGYPLSGSGDIAIAEGSVNNVALTLVSDVNSLQLEGSISPQLDLLWELQAPALTQVLEGLAGEISGTGTLTGTPEAPQIAGTLEAAGLSWSDNSTAFHVASLSANASYSGTSNAVTLEYNDLSVHLDGRELVQDTGVMEITGTLEDHAFSLSAQGPVLSFQFDGEGGYTSPAWRGSLTSADLKSAFGNWRLQDVLPLALSSSIIDVANHCWQMQAITMCGQAGWTQAGGANGNLAIDNIPLAWLNDNLRAGIPGTGAIREQLVFRPQGLADFIQAYQVAMPANSIVDGMLDLTMDFSGLTRDLDGTTLQAVLAPRDLSLGILRQSDDDADTDAVEVERYGIDEIDLTVERMAGRWQVNNSFEIYLGEAGGLDFQGDFSGSFQLADDQGVGGNFALTFNNIAWVEVLVPTLSQVRGELGANGTLSGTLQSPVLNLDARLDNGGFQVPEFGLTLADVNLDLRSANNNEISINGTARSGAGNVRLDSLLTMPLLESRTLHLEVRGENFELLNTGETRMTVAPDLVLDYRNQVLNVSGSLDVPGMHIDFTDRPVIAGDNSVEVSRDVVIVTNDGIQRQAGSSTLLGLVPVTGEVRLGMGDDVTFRGYGLDLKLTGNLVLEQNVDRPMLAHGELSIPVGSYEIYGQRLTINDGKLLFLGNPLNPALDIRAIRQTREAEVGLLMNGTARKINAQLFSTPTLPESEVLSLLITGNSIGSGESQDGDNMLGAIALLGLEKGQGLTSSVTDKLGIDTVAISNNSSDYRDSAIGLGKYLRPNLFMRYDIGLFDRENVLTLDYILTERLRLEVETGVSQSVDLTYTVEK